MFNKALRVTTLLIVFGVSLTHADTTYVDADATGSDDGTNWCNAYRTLQDGLSGAGAGDLILVANGTYRPDQGAGQTAGDQSATFALISGVALEGGYAGCNAPDPDQRDILANETNLSGDLNGDDTGDLFDPSRVDNSTTVVTGDGLDSSTRLDGFTIRSGGGGPGFGSGSSGIVISGEAVIANCTIREHLSSAGCGGMSGSGSLSIINSAFIGNGAENGGGGLCLGGGQPTVVGSVFFGNWASKIYGGGILAGEGTTTIVNSTFSANAAGAGGGGGVAVGGGVVALANCILWGNTAYEGDLETNQIAVPFGLPGTLVVSFTDIEGLNTLAGNNNIGEDPQFVDAANGNLRLLGESPCIDAGDNSVVTTGTDIDGNPRVVGSAVDMGAYEFQSASGVPAASTSGLVALTLLMLIAGAWFMRRSRPSTQK